MISDEELLRMASAFDVLPYDNLRKGRRLIRVENRGSKEKPSWSITDDFSQVLGKDGDWKVEPMPSNRDTDFFEKYRWNDLQEAIEYAKGQLENDKSGNR